MAIRAKIILPDNLESTFLRGELLERGAAYSSKPPQANAHSLVLGFALEDTETREPVPLERVVSLKISNDPQMAPESTIEITNWPDSGVYDRDTAYRFELSADHFFDPVANPGIGAAVSGDPDLAGYFEVTGWPLSANGGLSTMYVKAVVKSTLSDEQVFYPEGYGIFDQILWQSERPSSPGTPEIQAPKEGFIGREALWRFKASEEPSSGIYSSGVSRYVGDLIEKRATARTFGSDTSLGAGTSSTASTADMALWPNDDTVTDEASYTAGASIPNSATRRVVYLNQSRDLGPNHPDIGAQAVVRHGEIEAGGTISVAIGLYDGDQPTPDVGTAYWAKLTLFPNGVAVGEGYRAIGDTLSPLGAKFSTTLPDHAGDVLRNSGGGMIELYVSQRPHQDFAVLTAYYTPTGSADSFALCRGPITSLGAISSLKCAVTLEGDSEGWAVDGMVAAAGRYLLDVDLGDCQTDDFSAASPSLIDLSGGADWARALRNRHMILRTRRANATPSRENPRYHVTPESQGVSLHTMNPAADTREYVELLSASPTFADRALIRWSSLVLRGDFYVAITGHPGDDIEQPPIAIRCDPDFDSSEGPYPPTIVVGFSTAENCVYITTRNSQRRVVTRRWLPWEGQPASGHVEDIQEGDSGAATTWTLIVSSRSPSGIGDGTWLSLRRGAEVVGVTRLEEGVSTHQRGVGYYVAVGARSYPIGNYPMSSSMHAAALVKDLLIKGLPPSRRDSEEDSVSDRHFRKANGNPNHLKPWLGQILLSGATDAGPHGYAAPKEVAWESGDRMMPVDAVAANSIPASSGSLGVLDQAPDVVDGLPTFPNMRILVPNQADASENGVYRVDVVGTGSDGRWTRAPELSSGASVAPFKYFVSAEPFPVRLSYTGATAGSGSFTVTGMPSTVDGVALEDSDLVMVSNGTARSGIYVVSQIGTGSDGVWSRLDGFKTDADFEMRQLVRVSQGESNKNTVWMFNPVGGFSLGSTEFSYTLLSSGGPKLDGTYWYIAQPVPSSFNIGKDPMYINCTTIAQKITPIGLTPFLTGTTSAMMEVKVRSVTPNATSPAKLRAKIVPFNAVQNGPEAVSSTPWVESRIFGSMIQGTPDGAFAHSSLAQFDLGVHGVEVSDGSPMWLLVNVPPGSELVSAHGTAEKYDSRLTRGVRSGVREAKSMWHKLFASYLPRHRNVYDSAGIHLRVWADSHARFPSMASKLSEESVVDIRPPSFGGLGRPLVTIPKLPTVRTVTMRIEAGDGNGSGVLAFRIGKEVDKGLVEFSEWQPYADFASFIDLLPCQYAHQSNSGVPSGLLADGETVEDGARILVYSDTPQPYVGIYHAKEGDWERAPDLDSDTDIRQGLRVATTLGTHAGTTWYAKLPNPADEPPYYQMDFTAWNWQADIPQAIVAQYTVYLHGSWPYSADGTLDVLQLEQNAGFDGPRRIWVQTMDAVGNISEADPINVPAQGIAVVDTVPPSGRASFVSTEDGQPEEMVNYTNALLRVEGSDRVTSVKDLRFRQIGSGEQSEWGDWMTSGQYARFDVGNPFPYYGGDIDGLRRVEVQFRDYGNNVLPKRPLWELIQSTEDGRVMCCMVVWRSEEDLEEMVYAGGVRERSYEGFSLKDSAHSNYGTGKAFYVVSTLSGSSGRTVFVSASDSLTLRVNGVQWTRTETASEVTNTFYVDDERGLVVLNQQVASGTEFEVDVVRTSAIVTRTNGRLTQEVADLGYFGEKIVLCLLPTPSGLLMGTGSGAIYIFDGFSVKGPVFKAHVDGVDLPIAALVRHRFPHESDERVYAATAGYTRLFRKRIDQLEDVGSWETCGANSADLASPGGGALSASATLGKVFVGTVDGKVIRYTRSEGDDGSPVEEVSTSTLRCQRIDANEPTSMPVSSLLPSGDGVWAGIGNKPEVWRFSVRKNPLPMAPEGWARTLFGRRFAFDPAPWQFYTSSAKAAVDVDISIVDGQTVSRAIEHQISTFSVSDPDFEGGFREYMSLKGDDGKETNFVCADGSDWEHAVSGKSAYTIELMPMRIFGTGKQGLRISDGRYEFAVSWSDDRIYASNGAGGIRSASISGTDLGLSAQSLPKTYGGQNYARRGLRKIWNFVKDKPDNPYDDREDRGPVMPGQKDQGAEFDPQGWIAHAFVQPGEDGAAGTLLSFDDSGVIENTTDQLVWTTVMRVTATMNGDPTIMVPKITGRVQVDGAAKVLMRARIVAADNVNLSDASLEIGWCATPIDDQEVENWVATPIKGEGEFHLYQFEPAWDGAIEGIALRMTGASVIGPVGVDPLLIDIDYIAIAADEPNETFSDNGTPVRIGVDGTRLKVWAGFTDIPQLDLRDFLVLPTERAELRFGKIDGSEPYSEWAYSEMSFSMGGVVPPMSFQESDFGLAWRFPSTGGVTHLLHHQGTAVALTRGLETMKIADNPDHRAARAWAYNPGYEGWNQADPSPPRLSGGNGVVRFLSAVDYRGALIASGQKGRIGYQS
jgi:hypothetical protein